MRLDVMNQWLGVKTPAEVFKKCPYCKSSDLLCFEGEVFCQHCSWDSVVIHAQALSAAQLRWQQKRAKSPAGIGVAETQAKPLEKPPQRQRSGEVRLISKREPCPEVA